MPHLVYTDMVMNDLRECQRFLSKLGATQKSIKSVMLRIDESLNTLTLAPKSGRVYPNNRDFREKFIRVGRNVYQALYAYDEKNDVVSIVAIRNSKQKNYQNQP